MSQGCATKYTGRWGGCGDSAVTTRPGWDADGLRPQPSISCKVLSISGPVVAWGRGHGPAMPQGMDPTWDMNKTSP